jgi:ABC-type glutathione transport system ATPase component
LIPLQTHNVALTGPIADFVVELVDGKITKQGYASDVLSSYKASPEYTAQEEELVKAEEEVDGPDVASVTKPKVAQANGQLIKKEEIAQGRLSKEAG